MMRLFVALSLPQPVKATLVAQQDALRAALASADRVVRWVAPSAMHLTLVFLGEVAEDTGTLVAACVARYRHDAAIYTLQLESVGAFPSLRRPQTVWCGVGGDVAVLGAVQARLAADLKPLGFAPDPRSFNPHLTLGRVRREATSAQKAAIGQAIRDLAPVTSLPWLCGPLILFQSTLTPQGPIYSAIEP